MSLGLLFTLLMTYGGSVVAVFRPYYGFLIYVCFSLIRPESLWFWAVPPGNYSRIIALAFLAGWALNGFGNWSLGAARRPTIALAAFWGWAAVSTLFCVVPETGITFLENMGKIVLPAIAGLTLINTRRDVYLLAWTIVASFGYVAYDLNNAYFDGFNRLMEIGFGGMDNNSVTIGMVAGVGFSFYLGLSETVWWRRYLAYGAAALMTHAVFFSMSRGGMLGLCVVGITTAIIIPKTLKNISLVVLGASIAISMTGPEVMYRFTSIGNASMVNSESEGDWSAESRKHLWGICLRMVRESPIVGKGPDHFPILVDQYQVGSIYKDAFGKGKEAHSLWLQIAAELGIPGVTFLALFYGLTMWELWKFARKDKGDSRGLTPGATARMVLASLSGFVVSSQFVSLEGFELPYYITIVGLGSLKLATTTELNVAMQEDPARKLAVDLAA